MRRTIFIGEGEVDGKSSFRSSPKAPVQNMPQVNKRTCRQQKLQGLFHSNKIKIRCVYTGYLEVLIENRHLFCIGLTAGFDATIIYNLVDPRG